MKAILMSGSFRKIEIPQTIINFINKNINDNVNISFIADDFKNYKHNDKFVNKLIIAFEEKNLKFNNIYIIDSRMKKDEMISKIKSSNMIFILGGDTLKQIGSIKHFGLTKYIHDDKKIVMGISAGAINMAKRVVLAKDIEDNIPELSIYKGLGFTDINIEPHCDFNNQIHWKDLEEASEVNKLVVMHDDSYIIVDDEDVNYYGSYCILEQGEIYYNNHKITLEQFLKEIHYD